MARARTWGKGIPGIAPRSDVFAAKPLPGQEFAQELLRRQLVFERVGGRVRLKINRQGVKEAVYTTEGRNQLCKQLLVGDVRKWAEEVDQEIHDFLLGRSDPSMYTLPLRDCPLRWGSGGVMSVVRLEGLPDDLWTPFFFRPVEPLGWNIALGASERESELNDPYKFLLREFLEETLVLPGKPRSQDVRVCKVFVIGDPPGSFVVEQQQAFEFAEQHIQLRNEEDFLDLGGQAAGSW